MTDGYVHRTRDERLRNLNSALNMPGYMCLGFLVLSILMRALGFK